MFRAHRGHHQERQIVPIQPLVAVTLCRWPCRVQVGSELPTYTRLTATTSCSSSGEKKCVNTTAGSCHSVSVAVSCAGRKFTSDLHTTHRYHNVFIIRRDKLCQYNLW